MNTPLKSRSTAILGTATIPGRPEEVSGARAFVARTLSAADKTPPLDSDAATLLTSELVANAIQHTASGDGGWFTVEVASLGPVIRVAVTDEGGPGVPCLTGDPLSSGDLALDGDLDGDIDLHTFLGLADGHAGFSAIRVAVHLDTDADEAAVAELHRRVAATSPVGQTLSNAIPVEINPA